MEKATFGAGCFWHVQDTFDNVEGVTSTTAGFMGGTLKHPSYDDVCTGTTGHTEVVQVVYDPKKVSYEHILQVFWEIHDPTTLNRQGPDIGVQYRSVIFYHSAEQKQLAQASKQALQKSGKFKKPIVTEIAKASEFYPAEAYHQHYFAKNKTAVCSR